MSDSEVSLTCPQTWYGTDVQSKFATSTIAIEKLTSCLDPCLRNKAFAAPFFDEVNVLEPSPHLFVRTIEDNDLGSLHEVSDYNFAARNW